MKSENEFVSLSAIFVAEPLAHMRVNCAITFLKGTAAQLKNVKHSLR